MEISEKDLENQLLEAGNKLLSLPSSSTELLTSLNLVENLLSGVEQSPSESMKEALAPSTKALISEELLRHSNADVKVAVASCISEITRITAPEAPYADDQMKEVFQLIVSSFEKLDDISSPSYTKRTSILETVAKVRSCVVMLDLECDELIVEMFRHFLRTIRDDHDDGVLSSMETIMILVVEESEDISVDLLSSILNFLKKENKDVLPAACQLGEKVIAKCASKLKPYLLEAVRSSGASLDDYSKAVADVCQAGDEAADPSDGDAANKNVADEKNLVSTSSEKAVEVAIETLKDAPLSEEGAPSVVGSLETVMSNGILQKGTDNTSAANDNSKETDLGSKDEKAEPSNSSNDILQEGTDNTSAANDNSKEADLGTKDKKAEPSHSSNDNLQKATDNTSAANGNSKEADLDLQHEMAELSNSCNEILQKATDNDSAANDDSKEADLDTQDEKADPSNSCNEILQKATDNNSAVNDNSKQADLDTQDEKAEPSNSSNGILQNGTDNLSAANDNTKEADLETKDKKAEPSNDILQKVTDNTCATNDDFKEADLDIQHEKAEPSNSSSGILQKGTDNTCAANDNSKEADLDMQDEKAEPSSNSSDGILQIGTDNTSAANDNSKEADLDMQDEKAEPSNSSETIPGSVVNKGPPKSKTKPKKSNKQKGRRRNSTKNSSEPLKPTVLKRLTEVIDTLEHQDDAKDVENIQSENPVVKTTEAVDNGKSSEAPIPSPKTSDNEPADISSPSPSRSLADETCSKAGGGKKGDPIQDGEIARDVDSGKDSDTKLKKEATGTEKKPNKLANEKASSASDQEESVPDAADHAMKEDDKIDESEGNSAQDLAKKVEVRGSQRVDKKKHGHAKSTPAKSHRKTPAKGEKKKTVALRKSTPKATQDESDVEEATSDVDSWKESDSKLKKDATGTEGKLNKQAYKKTSSASDQEESVPDPADDSMKEDDNIDESDGNSAQDLAKEVDVGSNQRADKKKRGQAKSTPAKSHRKTLAKEEKKKTVTLPKSTPKAIKDESDVEEALRSSNKRKHPSKEKASKTKVYGRELVGATVRVWWPDDEKFYQGVVDSFDSSKKTHTVLYDDGDVEVLVLKEEKWQLINPSEGHASDGDSPDESADEMPIVKKAKTSADLDAKLGKTVSSTKKSGASSSKSKATSKSGSKQEGNKIAGKSEEASKKAGKSEVVRAVKSKALNSGSKLFDDAPKSAKKSKDADSDTLKSCSKSKQDKSSTGALKSKGKTPKSVGKSSSGTSGKAKAVTSTNNDDSEDESLEPDRTPEKPKGKSQSMPKSQNNSKKRKRSAKG